MIRLTFRDGCTGDDDEVLTFTAPRTFFWSFARWCEEGRARAIQSVEDGAQTRVYGPTVGKKEAERLVREKHGYASPEFDTEESRAAGPRGKHWTIEGPRYAIDWFSVYHEHSRGGISYRDPDNPEQPVYEIVFRKQRDQVERTFEKAVSA